MWLSVVFQAEDGIRDLVRSRGLVDVYKRQGRGRLARLLRGDPRPARRRRPRRADRPPHERVHRRLPAAPRHHVDARRGRARAGAGLGLSLIHI